MRIEIGNIKEDKWSMCKPNIINVEKNTEYQTLDIISEFNKNKQDFRIIFISSESSTYRSKFVVNRLRLLGV